jgi:hypothetical protein
MPSAEKKKIGRSLNEECPICHKGRLKAITRVESGNNGIIGGRGHSWRHTIIERLGCSKCGASYESKDRGVIVEERLAKQWKDFKNPETKPERCESCKEPLSKDSHFQRDPLTPRGSPYGTTTTFLFCKECLIVAFVTVTTKDRPIESY